jgi:hypothetical protein
MGTLSIEHAYNLVPLPETLGELLQVSTPLGELRPGVLFYETQFQAPNVQILCSPLIPPSYALLIPSEMLAKNLTQVAEAIAFGQIQLYKLKLE